MTEPANDRPEAKPKINPFLIPGREDAPMTPLCPWRADEHTNLYITVDNYRPAFEDFQAQFTTPSLLKESSRLALVAGHSGCGKSALRNHCAHWLCEKLADHGMSGEVIDLSREIDLTDREKRVIDINKRIAHVSNRLIPRLARLDLIDAGARDTFANAETPGEIYGELAAAMENKGRPEVVLILLLPSSDHLGEVEQYAAMPGPRVVFFAESSFLDSSQLGSIGSGNDVEVPAAKMTVGPLSAEDIRLFIDTRFAQRTDDGVFPRLDDDVLEQVMATEGMSVARLQSLMSGLYNHVRKVSEHYTDEARISSGELNRYLLQMLTA